MKILGLQKTTLIDYPGKVGCTIFLYGCNFRCGFCYNSELVTEVREDNGFSTEEILSFLQKRKDKLDAVCITGGEPLLTLTKDFLEKIKKLGYLIKIDTNGTNPEKLQDFIDFGLVDYVAMDIKGAKEDYEKITSSKIDINRIEKSIKLISEIKDYEFRTTVLPEFHDKNSIKQIGEWLNKITGKRPKLYCLQGFKKQGNFIDKKYENHENTALAYLNSLKDEVTPFFEGVKIRW